MTPTKCKTCQRWNIGLKRCTLGKTAPDDWAETQRITELMGPTYICMKAPHWRKLIATYAKEK